MADALLVPVQPRFDVWGTNQVAALVAEAREVNPELRALAILNAADAQGRDNAEALEALREIAAIETLDAVVVRRKAFPNAAAQGRAVTEQKPADQKAVDELCAVAAATFR